MKIKSKQKKIKTVYIHHLVHKCHHTRKLYLKNYTNSGYDLHMLHYFVHNIVISIPEYFAQSKTKKKKLFLQQSTSFAGRKGE